MATLAHILNPVDAPANKELMLAQSFVFESIRRARTNAACAAEVQVFSVSFPEDHQIIPELFTKLPDLKRSVQDVGFFSDKRKLPLIKDILESVYSNTEAEYIIFSNADIVLMPFFYDAVQQIIGEGYDAFIINRRRISGKYHSISQMEAMYAELGKDHTGYDCFVFKRELFPKFILGDVCVGIPHAGNELAHNLFCFPEKFRLFNDKHLTFHVGMDLYKEWGAADISAHNKSEFVKVAKALRPYYRIQHVPGSGLGFFKRHYKWLMNYTLHYPTLAAVDLSQLGVERPRHDPYEAKDSRNRYMNRLIRRINFD